MEKKSDFYKHLLEKYSEIINEYEKKTVGQIKARVTKDDLTVESLSQNFSDSNYLISLKNALKFFHSNIECIKAELSFNYWLSPKEILELKMCEDEDLSIFLCSVLFALGDENAKVVIAEMQNETTKAFVLTEFNKKFYILDPSQKHKVEDYSGTLEKAIRKYSHNKNGIEKFLYSFNASEYKEFI